MDAFLFFSNTPYFSIEYKLISSQCLMAQNHMTPKDLEPVIGRMNRVYEVLNHTRPRTLKMIRNLHEQFGIPAESLIKEPAERHFVVGA